MGPAPVTTTLASQLSALTIFSEAQTGAMVAQAWPAVETSFLPSCDAAPDTFGAVPPIETNPAEVRAFRDKVIEFARPRISNRSAQLFSCTPPSPQRLEALGFKDVGQALVTVAQARLGRVLTPEAADQLLEQLRAMRPAAEPCARGAVAAAAAAPVHPSSLPLDDPQRVAWWEKRYSRPFKVSTAISGACGIAMFAVGTVFESLTFPLFCVLAASLVFSSILAVRSAWHNPHEIRDEDF